MRTEFAVNLTNEIPDLSIELAESIISALDKTAAKYKIEKECVDIIVVQDLPDEVKQYLVSKKIEGLADTTIGDKKLYLEMFFRTVQKPVAEITTNDIRAYLFLYKDKRQISDRSLEHMRNVFSAFFKWCYDNDLIDKDVSKNIKPIKYEKKQRRHMNQLELEMMREGCDKIRDKALVEFLYSTGCRVSELCGVKLTDINWEEKTVKLFGKGKKERIGYLNAKSILALRNYLSSVDFKSVYLFSSLRAPHGKLTAEAVQKQIKLIAEKAGVSDVSPHIFRHTTATQALKSGMPLEQISMMLGHANLNTTRIYAEVDQKDVCASHERYIV